MRKIQMLAVVLAALAAMFVSAGPASATATGCTAGNPQYGPSYFCGTVNGSGNYVSSVSGMWRGSGWVCNYYLTAQFTDYSGHVYQTLRSGTASGCGTGGSVGIGVYSNKYSGYVYITLHYANSPTTANRTIGIREEIHP